MTVVLWAFVVVALLGMICAWAVLYQIVRVQGRILIRLANLEEAVGGAPQAARGLEPGSPLSPFQLPDLAGLPVSLEDFRGKRVLLVNWSPTCGFCHDLAPQLGRLQTVLRAHNTELLLVTVGGVDENRELLEKHGLTCPVLVQDGAGAGAGAVEEFKSKGTPVAYLLDEQGRVALPLAIGSEETASLARSAARAKLRRLPTERPLSDSRIERNGLRPGTPAPDFKLPAVNVPGKVSLADYHGRRVLLVFSDPKCGPCMEMLPELSRLHRELDISGPELIMVSRGEVAENEQKCQQHRVRFPVVIQRGWKLSEQYGIFATPVGFLIDEQGVIAREVAIGSEDILSLMRDGQRMPLTTGGQRAGLSLMKDGQRTGEERGRL